MRQVAVIGAGPAGLTAAYRLAQAGIAVDLYESQSQVGGLAQSLDLWGHRVDLGPHRFFSNDLRVNNLWLEVIERDYSIVNRLTRIYYKGRFLHYPLNPLNALGSLGVLEAARCVFSAFSQRNFPDDGTYETWLVQKFGRRLYEIFFREYSEKLWGRPCSQIDAAFAAQRIRKLSLKEALKDAFHLDSERHQSLCEQFAYPHRGSGELYERMAARLPRLGGRLFLKSPVRRVRTTNNSVQGIELESGESIDYPHVVSSMPLPLLVQQLGDPPPAVVQALTKLRFRNTVLIYFCISTSSLFPDQWIYIQSPGLRLGRVSNFNNWGAELNKNKRDSVLCLEYWCSDEDECWRWDDGQWENLAISELQQTTLLGTSTVLDKSVKRISRSYPVYHLGYRETLAPVETYLREISGLDVIGRYGAFKYNNQDHSILMGLLAAERIANKAEHDLWAINSSDESYQATSRIDESGLVIY